MLNETLRSGAPPAPLRGGWGWLGVILLLTGGVAAPMGVIFASWWGGGAGEVWVHLAQTVLGDLLMNTLWLLVGVGIGVVGLGTGLAWLTAMYRFPGRDVFDWALMLPLAVPAYVLAFVLLGITDFGGPLQGWLLAHFGPKGYWFPNLRSTFGVVMVMVLVLYPYVYLLARGAFLSQGQRLLEAARCLGRGPWGAFFHAALPMARPAIAAGAALALMEALADFGAVAIFNYDTFTTAIYKAWFGLFNLQAAAQLSSLLIGLVAVALVVERSTRGRARYVVTDGAQAAAWRLSLSGVRGWLAALGCGMVLALAFLIPVGQLLVWLGQGAWRDLDARYGKFLWHTLVLGGGAAVIIAGGALLLGVARQQRPGRTARILARVSVLGYAFPGTVLAVGVMQCAVWVDQQLVGLVEVPWFSRSVAALWLAYGVRFLAVAYGPVESGLERIRPAMIEVARSLGTAPRQLVRRVHLPMLRPGMLAAVLLVLVEVMKEMPATLLLRPFGWDTLAVRIFELTSEGEWQRAALPAITLILAGLVPIVFLMRRSE